MSLVFVDLDGTLLVKTSAERLFFRYLVRRKVLGIRQGSAFLTFTFQWIDTYGKHVWKKNKAYLAHLKVCEIESLAAHFVHETLMQYLCPTMRQRLEMHHRNGDETVLLTGTLDCIAKPLILLLEMPHCCATVCETVKGRFSHVPPIIHPYGQEKLRIGRDLCRKLGYHLSECTAYANSIHDRSLLEAVARPVVVHPDRRLRRIADSCSWEIIA